MKRKVLFFLYSLSGGGAERTVVNIINNLDKDKYSVVLVLASDNNSDYLDLLDNNIEVKVLKIKRLRFSLFKLRNCIIKENPDILFSTINGNNIIMLLAKFLSFKKIPTIIREASNRTQSGSVTHVNRILTKVLYNRLSTKIIALSEGVKYDLVNNFHINENKIVQIYNPVEVDKIIELSGEEITDLHKNDGEKLIVTVGRMAEAKDHRTLIRAFSILSKKIKAKLIIVGRGEHEKELKVLSNELGLGNSVQFIGFKKNPYKYMKAADVFVLSSRWEGFGHVIVEAMSTGTPVISTDCNSGPREIIQENKYGVLVPVGGVEELSESLVELLSDSNLLNYYSTQGRKRAKDFLASHITKQYEKVFEECY
ncbi:glycosyltransferase [Oceanobacillus luteolus]|uniref:Glycosyltransferase n=1 Tax=Oceanobacillus luteolus TaxID=1274358 RepID=A0ABW4HND4_9BACI